MSDEAGPGAKRVKVLEGDDSPDLELELDLGRTHSNAPVQGAMEGEGARTTSGRPQPLGRAIAAVQRPIAPVVDTMEARLLAKYPQAPTKLWEYPGYAKAVKERLAELETQAAQKRTKAEDAKAQLDAALVGIARRAVTLCEGLNRAAKQPYAPTLAHLASQEAQLRAVDGERMAKVDATHERALAIAKRLRPAENDLERARTEERQASAGLEGGPKSASAAQAKVIEAAHKKVLEAQAAVTILREERSKLEAEAKSIATSHDPAAEAARADYNAICADFAQFAMDDTVNFGEEFSADRVTVTNLREVAERADKDAALYRAAADSYDRDAVAKGRTVVIGAAAAGAVVLLLLLVLILR
jgi:hypothetical protein